jgi:hypothetical protein
MWRRVDLLWTDVSEERITSIFRVEKPSSEEPAWAGGCRLGHQSKTPSYMRRGRDGEWVTWEINREERGRVCRDGRAGSRPGRYKIVVEGKSPLSLPLCSYIAGCFRLVAQSAATCSRCFLSRELFYSEDGGDKFLRNVGSHKIYKAPYLRRRHSS